MDTAPFQQLESDKIQHLLAEGLDSLRLHSAVRDCPALRTEARVVTQLGTWCLGQLLSLQLGTDAFLRPCILAPYSG